MDIENLLSLQSTEIDNILFHLNKRYNQNKIYTYAGKILIAVNPFQITDLYSDELKNKFLIDKNYKQPHLYELANDAIHSNEKNLAFLISGESGSGKTESTKRLLDYFANYYKDVNNILPKILEFNNILEAFGNATTIRNHNSSRFGKYITVNINSRGEISAKIKTYLLEKIRIVSENLCNYHIFYSFGYKNNKPDYLINKREDWDSNYLSKENLKNIWIKNELGEESWIEIEKIIHFLIGLLEGKINENYLQKYINFLNIDDYNNVLSYKTIHTGEETIKSELTVGESKNVMQTIAMTLYDKLFERIVVIFNEKLGNVSDLKKSFGILDIFGFEVFTKNGFEQLCINYTNEKLQSIFNKYVFEEEIKMFELEGILKERISFETNSHILDFFDKKQNGFFPLLDEKSILGANDGDLERTIPKNDKVIKFKLGTFLIKHYAENVEYEWGDFSLKNVERANTDILEFCNKIYKNIKLFSNYVKKNNKRGSIGNLTITNQFRSSLNSLIDELDKSQLYFIRCIKPNEENKACLWQEDKIINQLNYCGIISAIELARQSFPIRMLKEDFLKKYEPVYLRDGKLGEDWIEELDTGDFLVGNSRVFYSKEKEKEFNSLLIEAQKELISKLIYFVKASYYRNNFVKKISAIGLLQNNYKNHLCKRVVREYKGGLYLIECLKRYWDRLHVIQLKSLVVKLEMEIKKKKMRKRCHKILCGRLIGYFIRKRFVDMIMEERNSIDGMISMRVDLAKLELDRFYKDKIDKLEKRVRELEKYEGLYNDLSGLINNNTESMIQSRMVKTQSEEAMPLAVGIESEYMRESVIIRKDDFSDWDEEKLEYVNAIQNLTNRVNYEFERYNEIVKYYDKLQYDFHEYKKDIKEAQILMSEKMYKLHNENIILREENIGLMREYNRNYNKSWLQKLFM